MIAPKIHAYETAPMRSHLFVSRLALISTLVLATLVFAGAPAKALVGAAPDARFADRAVMVLMRGGGEAGFCSALVIDSRTVLTAAHCLKS